MRLSYHREKTRNLVINPAAHGKSGTRVRRAGSVDHYGQKIWSSMHPRNYGCNKIVSPFVHHPFHISGFG